MALGLLPSGYPQGEARFHEFVRQKDAFRSGGHEDLCLEGIGHRHAPRTGGLGDHRQPGGHGRFQVRRDLQVMVMYVTGHQRGVVLHSRLPQGHGRPAKTAGQQMSPLAA